MKWTVTYRPSAKARLATLWLDAGNRQAVADAANAIEQQLASDPQNVGESREGSMRVLIEPPLAVLYDVSEPDRTVSVWSVLMWA